MTSIEHIKDLQYGVILKELQNGWIDYIEQRNQSLWLDNIDIYDLILQEIVDDKPDLFVDIDFKLILITRYLQLISHLYFLKIIFSKI